MTQDATLDKDGSDAKEEKSIETPEETNVTQEPEAVEEPEDPRMAEMDRIAENLNKQRKIESGIDPEAEEPVEEEEVSEEPEPEKAEEPAADKKTDDEMVEIKVAGQVKYVPKSQIMDAGIRATQKTDLAEERLQRATELLQRAEAIKAEQPPGKPNAAPVEPSIVSSEEKRDALLDISKKLQYGDDDEMVEALERLTSLGVEKTPGQTLTKEDVLELVEDTRITKDIMGRFQAPPDEGGFKDLTDVPWLKQAAIDKAWELINEGASDSDWGTYKQAGDIVRAETRAARGLKDPGPGTGPTLEEKRAAKAKLDIVKPTGGSPPVKTPKEASPPSASEAIREIAKARGQAL